jgi:hypothetical protein
LVQPIRGTVVKEKGKRSFFIKNFSVSSSKQQQLQPLTQHEYDLHSLQRHAALALTPTNTTL